jgi:hypothetical protein
VTRSRTRRRFGPTAVAISEAEARARLRSPRAEAVVVAGYFFAGSK